MFCKLFSRKERSIKRESSGIISIFLSKFFLISVFNNSAKTVFPDAVGPSTPIQTISLI